MPNGIGFDWQGHPSVTANGQLATIAATSSSGGLLGAAETAVRSLAASAGVRLVPEARPPARRSARSGGGGAVVAIAAIAAVLLLVAAGAVALRRRSGRRRRAEPAAAPPPPVRLGRGGSSRASPCWYASPRGFRSSPWSYCAIEVRPRDRRNQGAPPVSMGDGPASRSRFQAYRSGRPPDQVGGIRGRPVILTFVDPLCPTSVRWPPTCSTTSTRRCPPASDRRSSP